MLEAMTLTILSSLAWGSDALAMMARSCRINTQGARSVQGISPVPLSLQLWG